MTFLFSSLNLCTALSFLLVVLLLLSDAAFLLQRRGEGIPRPLRALAWLQRFAFALGAIAVLLALLAQIGWLFARHLR